MNRRSFTAAAVIAALGLGSLGLAACKRAPAREVTVAAAASLRAVLPALIQAYEKTHPGAHVIATYGASGDLKKQVEGGAPVDAVLFAAARPVDDLVAEGLADKASRRVVATNQIVLIAPAGSEPSCDHDAARTCAPAGSAAPPLTFATLTSLPPGEHLAVGDPGAVPAGQYARAYLTSLGEWGALQGRLVLGGDVSAVLAYARRGEVAAAIVYRTEVRGVSGVVVLDRAKGPGAPRPEVVDALVRGGHGAGEAASFLAFVGSPEGQKIFADFGFGPP